MFVCLLHQQSPPPTVEWHLRRSTLAIGQDKKGMSSKKASKGNRTQLCSALVFVLEQSCPPFAVKPRLSIMPKPREFLGQAEMRLSHGQHICP
jgi:hypothetical protein